MLAEEDEQQYPVQLSQNQQIKKEINKEIIKLIELLKTNTFKQKSIEKGWINEIDEEKGKLRLILSDFDPSKKYVLSTINCEICKLPQSDNKNEILVKIGKISGKMQILSDLMIEEKIKEYFYHLNIGEIIDIKDNQDGIQFKKIVSIRSLNQNVDFYVKTHSGGLLRTTNKSTSKPVDPIELLTYKILEYSGYGTESHFFYDDIKNFYICTKDVAFYADDKKVRTFSSFLTSNKDKLDFPRKIKITRNGQTQGPPLAEEQSILDGLMAADIISRIFCLSDILSNDGNIIFIKEKQKWKLKIIDFRNNKGGYPGYPDGSSLYSGLVSGFGHFFYVGMDNVISKYLGTFNLGERIKFARNFNYNVLREALGKASGDMFNYMSLVENFRLFQTSRSNVFEYCAAMQNIISQFEKSACAPTIKNFR